MGIYGGEGGAVLVKFIAMGRLRPLRRPFLRLMILSTSKQANLCVFILSALGYRCDMTSKFKVLALTSPQR